MLVPSYCPKVTIRTRGSFRAVTRNTGKTVAQLSEAVLSHQGRIAAAASNIANPDTTIFVHGDGTEDSVPKRLEALAQRWKASSEELQKQ